jgi:hypothetical protein
MRTFVRTEQAERLDMNMHPRTSELLSVAMIKPLVSSSSPMADEVPAVDEAGGLEHI